MKTITLPDLAEGEHYAGILLKRGHCAKADLTKTYRKHGAI